MPDDTESYFVSLAVQRGMATREAAQECLELARTPRAGGRSVVHLLVERARIPTDKARVLHQEAVAMATQARGRGADLQRYVSESTTGSGHGPPPTPTGSQALRGGPPPPASQGPTASHHGRVAATHAGPPSGPPPSWPAYDAPGPGGSQAGGSLLSRVRTFNPGDTFGRYRLESELGRGGMGVVWRARQLDLDRPVAVKMLLAGATGDDRRRRRFLAEARAVARLVHPNIVSIHDVGEHEGVLYFTMDLVEGPSLAEALKPQPFPLARALAVARGILDGLICAHAQKLVHRDLKPANILLDARGTPRITDFGIAKDLEAAESHTITGEVLGTPTYMPPEQADGRTHLVDGRADIYALGAMLYRMIAGRPPFEGVTPYDVISKVLTAEPTPLRKLDRTVPEQVDAMVLRCLAKDREKRYPTAEALAQDIALALERLERRAAPARAGGGGGGRGPLLAAAAVVAVLGVGVGAAGLWYANERAEDLRRQQDDARRRAEEEEALRRAAARREQGLARARDAQGLLQAEKPREALAAAREAVDLAPDAAEALVALGTSTFAAENDARAALDPLDRALSLEPDHLLARVTRARCLLSLERPQPEVEAEINHVDRLGTAGRSAAAELRADVALRKGELAVALVHLDEAVHHDDKNARLRVRYAELLLRARRFSAADEQATAALRLERTVAALVARAAARKELGRSADALVDAEEALELEPQHAQARALAEALRQKPQQQPTPPLPPGPPGDHSAHASVHTALKALREALARRDGREAGRQLQLALEIRDVPCAPALTERAQLLIEVERFQEAAQDLERLRRLQGETVSFHLLRAELMERTKRPEEADRSLARAIELDPRDYRPHEARAQLLEGRKDMERAAADWDQVVAKAPPEKRGWLVHERAHYFHRIGQLDRALADMDEALGQEKANGHLWLVRGEIRAEMGQRDGAISDLKEALRVGLRGNEEQRAKKKLEQLQP